MSNITSDKIMSRVAALLAVAEHPGTPAPEAETALRMANSLITKHAIDEAILRQSQTIADRREIRSMRINLGSGTFTPYLRTIFLAAADALRVSVGEKSVLQNDRYVPEAWLYGANEDVVWLEMLFSMIKLQFLLKIDPKWDNNLGYDANVYNFKVAGFKWSDINQKAIEHGHASRESKSKVRMSRYAFYGDIPADAELVHGNPQEESRYDMFETLQPNGFFHKMKTAYVRHAKAIGDDTRVVTQSHEAYRLSFAEAFRSTMEERFYNMKRDAESEMDSIPGAALAIRDMKQDADEALWAEFPDMDPEEIARRREAFRAQQEAERAARDAKLAAMSTKERTAFLEAEEKVRRANMKANRAWAKKNTRYLSRDLSATQRGNAAAAAVDLSRKAGSAGQRATRGQIG